MGEVGRGESAEVSATADLRLSRKLYPSLSLVEISFYTAAWCMGVYLSLMSLFSASQNSASQFYSVELIKPWWKFGYGSYMKKDHTDHEWETWKRVSLHIGGLIAMYPLFSQLVKNFFKDLSLAFAVIYSVIVTMYLIGVLPTIYLFLQITLVFLAYFTTSSAKAVWVVSISYILCLNIYPLKDFRNYIFSTENSQFYEGYLTSILLAWMNARCVSFSLDRLWNKVEPEDNFWSGYLHLTAYCFYLPLGVMGPLVSSRKFKESLTRTPQTLNKELGSFVVLQTLRYLLWFTVTDISLYFMYQQAFTLHPHLVNSISLWALCGMGYFMGQFFQLKYVVMYGLSSFLAKLDGVAAPPHPKCIGRIHLYSDMWRYFDHGLYLFMQEYIYLPVLGDASSIISRLLSSAVCFSFVYVWHGTLDFVMVWSCLNFAGITCEGLARAVGRNQTYQTWEAGMFGPVGVRRLHALLSCPLLLMSSLSNFYFFTGVEVGHIFVRRVLLESWPKGLPTILFFLYCCSQTSIEVKNYEIKQQLLHGRDRKL